MANRWTLPTLAITLFVSSLTARAQDDVGAKVYMAVHPSIASLKSIEGSGTGYALNEEGLILTNAHVMTSPLPYQCRIDVFEGGKTWSQVFRQVEMIGLHPKLDLALVKVDVKSLGPNVKTKPIHFAKDNTVPGATVFAIGNPGGGEGTLDKTITNGVISATSRTIDDVNYIQFSAPVNPGNSGGPLCNKTGEVLGTVTLKGQQEGVGYAIPLKEINNADFVALKDRKVDSERAAKIIKQCDGLVDQANKSGNPGQRAFFYFQAANGYHAALSIDPGDKTLYFKIGAMLRRVGRHPVAAAYLVRGIELDPWFSQDAYVDLGIALAGSGREPDARVVFDETFSKFTTDMDQVAVAVAKAYEQEKKNFECAYYARLAASLDPIPRLKDEMMKLYDLSRDRTPKDKLPELDELTKNMDEKVKAMQTAARKAKNDKTPYVNKPFEELITHFNPIPPKEGDDGKKNFWKDEKDATEKVDAAPDPFTGVIPGSGTATAGTTTKPATTTPTKPATPDTTTTKPTPKPKPEVDPIARRIQDKMATAKLLYLNKQKDKAIELLDSVIDTYPDHEETKKAKALRDQYAK